MAAMALAAAQGGAAGIRANSSADIGAIRAVTSLPIVGLFKVHTQGSSVYITPDCDSAAVIAQAGCHLIAVDATPRPRPTGVSLVQLVNYIHTTLHKPVIGDVSCLDDALFAEAIGVDCVATTLAGYTEHGRPSMERPDLEFLEDLVAQVRIPVVAEGRYSLPSHVARAFKLGAAAVVVGSAITRPQLITRRFVAAIPSQIEVRRAPNTIFD